MDIPTKSFDYSEMEDIYASSVSLGAVPTKDLMPIIDRDSLDYKKATHHNEVTRRIEDLTEDPLTMALLDAKHLTNTQKAQYTKQAQLFLDNMQDNIFSNQFQLAEAYSDYTADEWNDFLQDRIVSVYINKHKRTLLRTAAEDNLANPYAKNKRDNLNLINSIKEEEQQEAQKNIVILRIPDIYD